MKIKKIKLALALSFLTLAIQSQAASLVNPPDVPLESGSSSTTKPNLMFIFDDSGSMAWDYLGDEFDSNICKTRSSTFATRCYVSTLSSPTLYWQFSTGRNPYLNTVPEALYFTSDLNTAYYNPSATYKPGVKHDGTPYANPTFTSSIYGVYTDNAGASLTLNLEDLEEVYYCTKSSPSTKELADPKTCVRNGVNNNTTSGAFAGTYDYHNDGYPNNSYRNLVTYKWTPHYNKIIPREFCNDNFDTCSLSSSFGTPAPVRWCKSDTDAEATNLVTGTSSGSNKCQKNYSSTYKYPRLGRIQRVNITSDADKQNFANWFTFYRTRHDAMRTSVGLAFQEIDQSKRVGFITINPGSYSVSSSKFLPVKDFTLQHKEDFYNKLYSVGISGGTPLREALSRVGRYFAGISTGINSGMINSSNPDPMEISCQQNFAILSTDGYWNGNAGQSLTGGSIGDEDSVNSGYSTRASGALDGLKQSGTLADVAMYYYKNDLRASNATVNGVNVGENNVPISAENTNSQQHMVTYGISLGLNGAMSYSKDYVSGKNSDLEKIKAGTTGCSWTSGVCNWPSVSYNGGTLTTIDDLWHATINGRGKYYSARDTKDIVDGLTDALNSLIAQTASSSSASTSSPNITATENTLFYSTYRTVYWDGDVAARQIDYINGEVSDEVSWRASTLLNRKSSSNTDSRTIYTSSLSGGKNVRVNFSFANLDATAKSYFNNKCDLLSQCVLLEQNLKNIANNGELLVNYLRGHRGYEMTSLESPVFRSRENLLGDIIDASPVYVSGSPYNWTDKGYSTHKAAVSNRTPMLYVGSNDGFLHAFNAQSGEEEWAYAPRQILHKMYALADKTYAFNHKFYVNGTISIMDAVVNGNWKTVLVGAMGQGSKGYYALDITNPSSPSVLWELCTDSSSCSVTNNNIGYTYGNPIITKNVNNQWVVYLTSGYDNLGGKGHVFEVDLSTGSILRDFQTGINASTSNPTGLSNINSYYKNFYEDNKTNVLYGGDLNGDVWRVETRPFISTNALIQRIGFTSTSSTNNTRQPISSKIELGSIYETPILFFGTGQYLNFADYETTGIQSVYAIKDPYARCVDYNYLEYLGKCIQNNFTGGEQYYGNLKTHSQMTVQTSNTSNNQTTATRYNVVDWNRHIGWYFDFKSQAGERVNIDPTLVLGTLNMVTNVPATNTCSMGGNAWIYQFNYLNGNPILEQDDIIGKKHIGGFVVGQVVARIDNSGLIKNFITDAAGNVQSVGVNLNTGTLTATKTSFQEVLK